MKKTSKLKVACGKKTKAKVVVYPYDKESSLNEREVDRLIDVDNVTDLPPEWKKKYFVTGTRYNNHAIRSFILQLLRAREELSLDEIGAAVYRKFKMTPTRAAVIGWMKHLCDEGECCRHEGKGGIYKLSE